MCSAHPRAKHLGALGATCTSLRSSWCLRLRTTIVCPVVDIPQWAISSTVCRILMVGGFKSSSERLEDLWVYSSVSRQWEEMIPRDNGSASFSPRGGHSACRIGSHLWIYGGYGGALHSCKDLEDLCVLDLESWRWIEVYSSYLGLASSPVSTGWVPRVPRQPRPQESQTHCSWGDDEALPREGSWVPRESGDKQPDG